MRSQTQQVNTQTGFPDQKSDLPLESDKVPIVTKRYETDIIVFNLIRTGRNTQKVAQAVSDCTVDLIYHWYSRK